MISITISSNKSIDQKHNYYSVILTVSHMKSRQMTFMQTSGWRRISLTTVIVQKIVNFLGKFKDEAAGKIITEFVGLRSKMYSYTKEDGTNNKTVRGIRKVVIKNDL